MSWRQLILAHWNGLWSFPRASSKLVHHRTMELHRVGIALGPTMAQEQLCLHHWLKPIMWYESSDVVCSQSTWVRNAELSLQSCDTEVGGMLRTCSRHKVIRSLGCHLEGTGTGPTEWVKFSEADCESKVTPQDHPLLLSLSFLSASPLCCDGARKLSPRHWHHVLKLPECWTK